MPKALPSKVCSFDIETAKTVFRQPEDSVLALAGVMEFVYKNGRYYAGRYKHFLKDQMDELHEYLYDFPGIIIGHNLFEFDYRVLRPYMSLKGIIEKSVDTLALLFEKNDLRFTGLSLDELSMRHFGAQKTLHGRQVSRLWRQGKKDIIIGYNKNDCILARKLWWHLVKFRSVKIDRYPKRHPVEWATRGPWPKTLSIGKRDFRVLTGSEPQVSYRGWLRKVQHDGRFLIQQERKNYIRVKCVPKEYCPRCGLGALIPIHKLLLLTKIPSLTKALIIAYEKRRWKASYCHFCEALVASGLVFFNNRRHIEVVDYAHNMLDWSFRKDRELGKRVEDVALEDVWKLQD